MRERGRGTLTRVPHIDLRHHTLLGYINEHHLSWVSEHEWKGWGFWGLSTLLIGIKEERPGKHLQLTSAFSIGTQIPHWVNVPWMHPAVRTKKQCAKIKTLKSHRPYRMRKKNQSALLPWVKHDQQSTEKQNLAKPASNAMFASGVNMIKTAGGNGTYMPKPFLSETTLCSARLTNVIILRE